MSAGLEAGAAVLLIKKLRSETDHLVKLAGKLATQEGAGPALSDFATALTYFGADMMRLERLMLSQPSLMNRPASPQRAG